jgi:ribosomal-protein-serine acetyltransferase
MHPTPFNNYLIRPMQQNDAAAFFKMVEENRPRLESGFAGTVSKTQSLETTEAFIANNIKRREAKEYFPFIIIDTTNQNAVGYIDVKNIDWNIPKAEFGCFLAKEYLGKGISKPAMQIVIDHLFNELNFTKLFLRTQPVNTEACGLAEKLGFEKEGLLRKDYKTTSGELVDLVYYGLLKK